MKNKRSEYVENYLKLNTERGLCRGLTPSSYIHIFWEKGNKHQTVKLINTLKEEKTSFPFLSKNGNIAYYSIKILDENIAKVILPKIKTILALKKLNSLDIRPLFCKLEKEYELLCQKQ